jgi:hypothetical protein
MKHSIEDLLTVVYGHYPRAIRDDDPRYYESEENRRLAAARRAAATASGPWRAMLERLDARFPECWAQNGSLHLPTGENDAGYVGALVRKSTPHGEHSLSVDFGVSFLVPYYIVVGSRVVDETVPEAEGDGPQIWFATETCYFGAKFEGTPAIGGIKPKRWPSERRRDRSIVPSIDDKCYWDAIASEIETTFGCERMPLDVVRTIVPDVMPGLRNFGQATLCDCLICDRL